MVNFITGRVNSGKSTKLYNIFLKEKNGDGFYNKRILQNGQDIGQDLIWMSTGLSVPFSRIINFLPDYWTEAVRYNNYSFSKQGLEFLNKIVEWILSYNNTAYIDEIGHLELEKKGLYYPLKKLLESGIIIYAVCRDCCLDKAIEIFNIKDFKI